MSIRFSILASGSRGNAAVVSVAGVGVLIDLGLGPRALAERLSSVGATWDSIASAALTHTHGDHVNDATLRFLARRRVTFHCHEGHPDRLRRLAGFHALAQRGLVRTYDDRPFLTLNGMRVESVPLSHDGGPTFGFRLEGRSSRRSRLASIGFVADTGIWTEEMADALIDVDLLALEFNHDVEMQRTSGRAPHLIARNLGRGGHLSNTQGSELLLAVLKRSRPGALRNVILLHLSADCNRPELAMASARASVRQANRRSAVHLASQWEAYPSISVQSAARRRAKTRERDDVVVGFPWEAA